jgi:hypothetical protein
MRNSRAALYEYFLTGEKPTQAQFADLIDSCFNWDDDTFAIEDIEGLQDAVAEIDAALDLINIIPVSVPFSPGAATPMVIDDWQTAYFPTYGNARFAVEFLDGSNNLNPQPIYPTRIIDRTGETPVQSGISLDVTGFPSGQLIIYYSKQPII